MEIIHQYTRKEAIEDGVLVMLCRKLVQEAGIRVDVAVTRAVYERCLRVPEACPWQDEIGRTWDVLVMFGWSARRQRPSSFVLVFTVLVQNDHKGLQQVQLKAVTGPGDEGEQVITIMFPDED